MHASWSEASLSLRPAARDSGISQEAAEGREILLVDHEPEATGVCVLLGFQAR